MNKFAFLGILLLSLSANAQNGMGHIPIGFSPALSTLQLGASVNFTDIGQFRPSPFTFVKDTGQHLEDVDVQCYLVRNASEIQDLLNTDVKVDASVPLVDIGAKGDIQLNVTTANESSNLKFVMIVKATYDPEVISSVTLTHEGDSLSKRPAEFIKRFGTYFCNSITKGQYMEIDVTLSQSLSSTIIDFFHSGQMNMKFSDFGLDIQDNIRAQIKQASTFNSEYVNIHTYGGGKDLSDYSTIVKNLFSGSPSIDSIGNFVKNILSQMSYKNSQLISADLSDYSPWGIVENTLVNNDIIRTQIGLKKLHNDVVDEILNLQLIETGDFSTFYDPTQISNVRIGSHKLTALKEKINKAHDQLNLSNKNFIDVDDDYRETFDSIKENIPETFEFLVSSLWGQNFSYTFAGTDQVLNNNMKQLFGDGCIFNTINSSAAFNYIDKIFIKNTLDGHIIENIDLNSLSMGKIQTPDTKGSGAKYLTIANSIEPARLDEAVINMNRDLVATVSRLLPANGYEKAYYRYNLIIVDKAGRNYEYPFINVSAYVLQPTVLSLALPTNACKCIKGYQVADNQIWPGVGEIICDFNRLNLKVSDSLVVEISTDNALYNNLHQEDLIIVYSKQELNELLNNGGLITMSLSPFSQINSITIKCYSKNKKNKKDSPIHSKLIPFKRALCNSSVTL